MGSKLTPIMQVKNLISSMVKSGAVGGEKAGAWTKKLEEEREVDEVRRKAEAGDAHAMKKLGRWYKFGTHGLPKDPSSAVEWFKRGVDLDHPPAIYSLGLLYLDQFPAVGDFAPASMVDGRADGLLLVSQAATMGVQGACHTMAQMYRTGRGVTQDLKRAQYWAKKGVDKDHLKFSPGLKDWAQEEIVRWAAGDFGPVVEDVE